ncbi:HIV Tat-specific factor 1 homolog [Octopus sinensis]|uniref:HIV Tat-specific factor 1 homolog n=1 Tax=Octopus sinensis TaxID=2607531 RepID=A0A6P7TYF0_9MOLL|nr:HIV Tat-specific factor 1 homolog [Octopus sinensis]
MAMYQMNYGYPQTQVSNEIEQPDTAINQQEIDNPKEIAKKRSNHKKKEVEKLGDIDQHLLDVLGKDEIGGCPINPVNTGIKRSANQDWFEVNDENNKSVYVSNLPKDITLDEFEELMKKYGLIAKDLLSNKLKIRLYTTKEGINKGDGLCTYIRIESVTLALNILNDYNFNGNLIKVERAKFEKKENFDPSKRPRKLTKKEKKRLKGREEKYI